jgi:hypothetical protein
LNFPSAQPLGEAGDEEVLEADIEGALTVDAIFSALRGATVDALCPLDCQEVPLPAKAATAREVEYEVRLPPEWAAAATTALERLLSQDTLPVRRRDGRSQDLRDLLLGAEFVDQVLRFRVRISREAGLRAKDLLEAMGLGALVLEGAHATRSRVILESDTESAPRGAAVGGSCAHIECEVKGQA